MLWLLVDVLGSLWITRNGLRWPGRRLESTIESIPWRLDRKRRS